MAKPCVECGAGVKSGHRFCTTCRRLKDPVWGVFYAWKMNARRRGLKFAVRLSWFREWVKGTEYMEKRGRAKGDLSLDKIVNSKGYVEGNIQVLTVGENARKGTMDYETYEEARKRWGTPF